MDIIKEKVEELVAAIEDSSEYQNFLAARKQVDLVPGLEDKIRKFCWENYELQSSDEEGLYERMEAFEEQYEEFWRNIWSMSCACAVCCRRSTPESWTWWIW